MCLLHSGSLRTMNQKTFVCQTDALIPTQHAPPCQHFSQQSLQKMTKASDTTIDPLVYSSSLVSLDALDSPAPLILSCSFTISQSLSEFSLEGPFI